MKNVAGAEFLCLVGNRVGIGAFCGTARGFGLGGHSSLGRRLAACGSGTSTATGSEAL